MTLRRYAERSESGEAAAFRGAGARLAGVNWMHDMSEAAVKDFGGATVSFHFEGE